MNYNRGRYRTDMRGRIPAGADVKATYAAQEGKSGPRIALAYLEPQPWRDILDPASAFAAGTVFRALDLPFDGYAGARGGAL